MFEFQWYLKQVARVRRLLHSQAKDGARGSEESYERRDEEGDEEKDKERDEETDEES